MAGVATFVPPRRPLDLVFAVDIGLQSYSWLAQLLGFLSGTIQQVYVDIAGVKVTVLVNGIQELNAERWVQVIENDAQICNFARQIKHTGISVQDKDFKKSRVEHSWSENSRRVLIRISDQQTDTVHTAHIVQWMNELHISAKDCFIFYDLQCCSYPWVRIFNATISPETGDDIRVVSQRAYLFDVLMAICYREANDPNNEKEKRARNLNRLFVDKTEMFFNNFRTGTLYNPASRLFPINPGITSNVMELKNSSDTKQNCSEVRVPLQRQNRKVAVGRKTVNEKATLTTKSNIDKFKESNLPLLKRENVPESNFNLRSFPWSSWRLAMFPGGDSKKNTALWEKRFGRPGYQLKVLPPPKSSSARVRVRPVVFEVAVQGRDTSKKRYVVFSATSSCSLGVRNWERRLLGGVRSQVDLVLNSGGRVYVRYCSLTSKSRLETSLLSIRKYDYAWRKIKGSRTCSRDLVKGDFVISRSGL